jgi:serine O-acetyltransferase
MTFKELVALLRADLLRLEGPAVAPQGRRPRWLKLLSPRFLPVLLVRLARYFYLSRWVRVFSPVFTWVNLIIFGIEFTPRCEVGAGLMLPHTSGTVVGALKIGANATIFHGVTLGAKFADILFTPETRPVVGDNVTFGAGAKILGGISIGQGAVIAANSLVIDDVAAGALMMGVPAIARGAPQ